MIQNLAEALKHEQKRKRLKKEKEELEKERKELTEEIEKDKQNYEKYMKKLKEQNQQFKNYLTKLNTFYDVILYSAFIFCVYKYNIEGTIASIIVIILFKYNKK